MIRNYREREGTRERVPRERVLRHEFLTVASVNIQSVKIQIMTKRKKCHPVHGLYHEKNLHSIFGTFATLQIQEFKYALYAYHSIRNLILNLCRPKFLKFDLNAQANQNNTICKF